MSERKGVNVQLPNLLLVFQAVLEIRISFRREESPVGFAGEHAAFRYQPDQRKRFFLMTPIFLNY